MIAAMLVVGSIGAGVGTRTSKAAEPEVACSVAPGMICQQDQDCAANGAICDTTGTQGICVCPSDMGIRGDMGTILDGGLADFATGGGGGGGTTGGSTNGAPPVVAGNSGPERSGCSYVPGSAR